MSKQQKYPTDEFRREAVRMLESSGKSVPELARELGIGEKSLYRWRKQYGTSTRTSPVASPSRDIAALEAELKQLRRENEDLLQQRDILKKALSIFSQSQ